MLVEYRFFVVGYLTRFEISTAIYGYINQNRMCAHAHDHFFRNYDWTSCGIASQSTNHNIGTSDGIFNHLGLNGTGI